MRDPREIYPGEPIGSILNRLNGQSKSPTPFGNPIPIPERLGVALIIAFAILAVGMFVVNQLIDHGFFG